MQNTTAPPDHSRPATLRLPRPRLIVAAVAIALSLVGLAFPTGAEALQSTGHGTGYLWAKDGVSWLGTYALADGGKAFCLEVGKTSPVGNEYDLTTGSSALGLSADDVARLAYISRQWAGTNDRARAAAGQLAVWTITGLGGHTQAYYAGRANENKQAVLQLAKSMLAEASSSATTKVVGALALTLGADGRGSVRADIVTTLVGGASKTLDAGSRTGTVTLAGATFPDGSASAKTTNGTSLPVIATGSTPSVTVKATMRFVDLPFGATVTIGASAAGSQMLLFATKPTAVAAADKTVTAVSPLPFQPRVQTQTSTTHATAGARISDALHVDVASGSGLLTSWGIHGSGASTAPIPVTVRSRLLGPFPQQPTESADWPADATEVCAVETPILAGAGDYTTPECTLPAEGYFVWVESIDPADTPADKGRDRVRGWKSSFASASEVSFAPFAPTISTSVEADRVAAGTCVADSLAASSVNSAVDGVDVESVLLGPFADAPADGHGFGPADALDDLPIAGRVTTTITGDGEYETPCVKVDAPGHYVFVFLSDGSETDADGHQVIPPFADLVAHDTERFVVPKPDIPEIPEIPEEPDDHETPPVTPKRLAYTGTTGVEPVAVAALGALAAGAAAVIGVRLARAIRGRRERAGSSS